MKTFLLSLLMILAYNFSYATSDECKAQIQTEILSQLQVDAKNFREVTFSKLLLENGKHNIWKNLGYELLSVQYYHDSEFVEVLVILEDKTCNIFDVIKLFQENL